MPPQIPKAPLRSLWTQCRLQKQTSAPFSTTTRLAADEPNPASSTSSTPTSTQTTNLTTTSTALLDSIAPARNPNSIRPSERTSTTTSANRSLFPFPRRGGSAPDTTTTPNSTPAGAGDLLSTLQRTFTPAYTAASRASSAATVAEKQRIRNLEAQATRRWESGDIYAPHDLSSVEMQKARQARFANNKNNLPPANTRKKGSRDVLDDLGINPLKEYRNFAMVGEWVSEMGRIRSGRETGLRGVNQRRVAKCVRRAVGLGLMPSVHRHPEMHEQRMSGRGRGF